MGGMLCLFFPRNVHVFLRGRKCRRGGCGCLASMAAALGMWSSPRCLFPAPPPPLLTRSFSLLQAAKRSKTDGCSPRSPPLSPELVERIRKNKEVALQKLAARTASYIPAELGQSWRVSLAKEFSKPYFAQVGEKPGLLRRDQVPPIPIFLALRS